MSSSGMGVDETVDATDAAYSGSLLVRLDAIRRAESGAVSGLVSATEQSDSDGVDVEQP
jgi:hypothetical protein